MQPLPMNEYYEGMKVKLDFPTVLPAMPYELYIRDVVGTVNTYSRHWLALTLEKGTTAMVLHILNHDANPDVVFLLDNSDMVVITDTKWSGFNEIDIEEQELTKPDGDNDEVR